MTALGRTLCRGGALLLLAACAQMDPPPGGPEDRMPPYVLSQQPDSLAVVPGWNRPVVVRFSERISEQQVEESVMVSPRTSPVRVDRGSREIRVSMRGGWEEGQIYQVTIRPIIQDLFNNALEDPVGIVFSTGPQIPETRLGGTVRDRITGAPEADARVEAVRTADSLVYAVPSDSAGRFLFAHVPEGEYLIRAFPDRNLNREVDPFEPRDSLPATIAVDDDTASVELSIVLPDSTSPVIASAEARQERRVDLRFDDYLDPAQQVAPSAVTITGPDGVAVAIAQVTVGEPPPAPSDTAPAADDEPPAIADTLALDTAAVAAAPDTLTDADTAAAAAAAAAQPVLPDDVAGADEQLPDTASAEPVLPSQLLVVQLAEGVELTPEAEYSVAVVGIRNIVGLVGDSEDEFTAPEPPEPPEPAADAEQEPEALPPQDPDPGP